MFLYLCSRWYIVNFSLFYFILLSSPLPGSYTPMPTRVCTCIHPMPTRVCTCILTHAHTRVYVLVPTHAHTNVYVLVPTHVCMCIHPCPHACLRVHALTHTRVYVYITSHGCMLNVCQCCVIQASPLARGEGVMRLMRACSSKFISLMSSTNGFITILVVPIVVYILCSIDSSAVFHDMKLLEHFI